jgi:hypothetical protein
MSDKETGNSRLNIILEALMVVLAFVMLIYWNRIRELNGYQWQGTGKVRMASMSSGQNGKATGTISARESAFAFSKGYIDYRIAEVTWPDGHKVSFGTKSCNIRSTVRSATCNDNAGQSWDLQILVPPPRETSKPVVGPANNF